MVVGTTRQLVITAIAIEAMEEDEKLVLELMTIYQKHVSNFPACCLMPMSGILSLITLADEPHGHDDTAPDAGLY